MEAVTLPTGLKSLSAAHPDGRTGRNRETRDAFVILSNLRVVVMMEDRLGVEKLFSSAFSKRKAIPPLSMPHCFPPPTHTPLAGYAHASSPARLRYQSSPEHSTIAHQPSTLPARQHQATAVDLRRIPQH